MEGDEAGLEEILDHLLEDSSGARAQPHRDTVTATVTYIVDPDPPMDTDETLHDSRMVSHSDSQVGVFLPCKALIYLCIFCRESFLCLCGGVVSMLGYKSVGPGGPVIVTFMGCVVRPTVTD